MNEAEHPAPHPGPPDPGPARKSDSEPPDPGPAREPILERPHPLTPLVRGWIVLAAMLYGVVQNLTPGQEDQPLPPWWVIAAGVGAVALVAALISLGAWWFTRFVIDDHEVRIETGWLSRRSRRVPFERIQSVDVDQPLLARIFGLAELRIEAGAELSTSLRYLPRTRCYSLRDYLMARAAGHRLTVSQSEARRTPSPDHAGVLADVGGDDRVLVAVPGGRVVGAFFLSGEVWFSLCLTAAALGVAAWAGAGFFSLAVVFPLLVPLASMVSRRLIHQFNFRLVRTPEGGLRVTSGLTRLISQSIPLDRIQGVRIRQPLLWRIPGWWRVDIDMVGLSGAETGEGTLDHSTVLPVGTVAEMQLAMREVLPGIDLAAVPMHPIPARARWLRWFDRHVFTWGATPQVAVANSGLFTRTGDIVPVGKFQSIRLTQGPLQRRLDLAHVWIDTTPGPVVSVTRHVSGEQARAYALTLLTWGRQARAGRTGAPPPRPPAAPPTPRPAPVPGSQEPSPPPPPGSQVPPVPPGGPATSG